MTNVKSLFYRTGRLICEMKGYGFSLGGGKGSFGYYPHLIEYDSQGHRYPIFPDTQVFSNLRFAVEWHVKQQGGQVQFVSELFGREGPKNARKIFVGDLRLDEQSRRSWSDSRFVIRARSEIEESSRTNRNRMLAFFEFSYLEGLTMEAPIMIGALDNKQVTEEASEIIDKAAKLITGFGASRSRGYGRANCKITWNDIEEIPSDEPIAEAFKDVQTFGYCIRPFFNIRHKIVDPGKGQLLQSQIPLRADQIRGWFVQAYKALYGSWPTAEEMATVSFSTFYPAWINGKNWDDVIPAYPAPMTTVRIDKKSRNDGKKQTFIEDRYEKSRQKSLDDSEMEEGYVQVKVKPLPSEWFLTNENKPKIVDIKKEARMRNQLDGSFTSRQLFGQELIKNPVAYWGTVRFSGVTSEFKERALRILCRLKPHLAGTLFEGSMRPRHEASAEELESPALLLVENLDFSPDLFADFAHCRLGIVRRYNGELNIPRRQHVVFMPASISKKPFPYKSIPWRAFGVEEYVPQRSEASPRSGKPSSSQNEASEVEIVEMDKHLTRSQRGILRRFLSMRPKSVEKLAKQFIEKYEKMEDRNIPPGKIRKEVFEKIIKFIKHEKIKEFRAYIELILHENAELSWNKRKASIHKELEQEKTKKGCAPIPKMIQK